MAAKKVGVLIKEARTNAGLSQEKLAQGIEGLSASDISKAERGEKDLTQDQLKAIAKATGVTQKSLLEAAAGTKTSSSSKSSSTSKTGSSSKSSSTSKTGSSSKSSSSSKTSTSKTTASSGTSMKVSATEKKIIELYREADSETKKKVLSVLKGEHTDGGDILNSLLEGALEHFMK